MDTELATLSKQPLGELLLKRGVISPDQLRIALKEQNQRQSTKHEPLGKLLAEFGFISNQVLQEALSERLGVLDINLDNLIIDAQTLNLIPKEIATRHKILPLSWDEETQQLVVAAANPEDLLAFDQIRDYLQQNQSAQAQITIKLADESAISIAIDKYYGHQLSIDALLNKVEGSMLDTGTSHDSAQEALPDGTTTVHGQPIIYLLDAILADAVKQHASDIHFEPEAGFLRIRYRLDGVLRQIRALHGNAWPAIAVRIKVQSGMNIAENRMPQDGRMSILVSGKNIDCRVSVQPTLHGENIVVRLLDRAQGIRPLHQLGLEDSQMQLLTQLLMRPEGIMLVTGPTGSGKTTTLYSILQHINHEGINIMTLENPVEYPIPWIRQTSLSDYLKFDFADGIRALLRQDPDVILVGEIRDPETASMTLRASMTGHQVFSTLHSSTALGAIPRLFDMGIAPDLLAANLTGVITQRLLRYLCPHCKEGYFANPEEQHILLAHTKFKSPPDNKNLTIYRPKGCELCAHQGYKRRMLITEILPISIALESDIAHREPLHVLRKTADNSYVTLAESGTAKVLAGETSLKELMRVINLRTT